LNEHQLSSLKRPHLQLHGRHHQPLETKNGKKMHQSRKSETVKEKIQSTRVN